MSKNKVGFSDYCLKYHREMIETRPKLLEVAVVLSDWWNNGKSGDVLNVSMPTRFGKSFISTAFSSWLLLHQKDRPRILRASYSADLAETFSKQVRGEVERWFELHPQFYPYQFDGTAARWYIDGDPQPAHAGISISGGITGRGFNLAIIDDTAKNMLEAMSAAYHRALVSFKESVLLGRLEGRRKILNVGTRWTVNDWFSMWPDAESYVLPAMVDGCSCCEAWKTTAELELERSRVSEAVWNAQYMQAPTETGQVRLFEGWKPATVADIPDGQRVAVIDPTTDYGRDFFVVGIYVRSGGLLYLVDMFARQRATPGEAARWLEGQGVAVAWIETNGAGRNVMEKMRQAGARNLAGFVTHRDKYSRAYVQAEAMRDYFRICDGCNPVAVRELLHEADVFPVTGDDIHDDLLDNVVMAFEKLHRI